MDMKKYLLNAGKVAITIASPPIGLPFFPKNAGHKAIASYVGVVASLLINFISMKLHSVENIIYDKPRVTIKPLYEADGNKADFSLFLSPLYFNSILYNNRATTIEKDGLSYVARGDDIIRFSDGKYKVNLAADIACLVLKGEERSDALSVQRSDDKIGKLEKKLMELIETGDMFAIREMKQELEKAKEELANARATYNAVREVFKEAVNKINGELEAAKIH